MVSPRLGFANDSRRSSAVRRIDRRPRCPVQPQARAIVLAPLRRQADRSDSELSYDPPRVHTPAIRSRRNYCVGERHSLARGELRECLPSNRGFGVSSARSGVKDLGVIPVRCGNLLYCDLMESPFRDWYEPVDGYLAVPQGPGLGIDPDPALLEKLSFA